MQVTDWPTTMPEFLARFGSNRLCRDHVFERRWPDGFSCERCRHRRCYWLATKSNVCECAGCGRQVSILTGTIFEQTKTGLSTWFLAIYLFASSKGGISALELQRQLGFKSNQTAWVWLLKIRAAMAVRGAPLEGRVEVDETYLGGSEPGKRGRHASRAGHDGAAGEIMVAGAVETRSVPVTATDPARLNGDARKRAEGVLARLAEGLETGLSPTRRRLGRVRLGCLGDASAKTLQHFMKASIAAGATIVSDGWRGDLGAANNGDAHQRIIVSKTAAKAREILPGPHLIFALVKRLLLGTYHGGVGKRHFGAYLDEYIFRFNRRGAPPAGRAMRLIDRALTTQPLAIRMIFARPESAA